MTLNILFAAGDTAWPSYRRPLANALAEAGLQTELSRSFDDPADVDYIVYAPDSPLQDFTPYTRLKLVQNLWAGVEDVVGNQTLTAPLARMVDPGLTEGMIEWVTAHVL
ncbi:MAG: glyoxylate/hydroxypyruvate reductase A, partial [Pseudomonadota bacterium]